MKTSVDISLYPLADEYIPAIKEFIERVQKYPDVSVVRNDLSTPALRRLRSGNGFIES